MEQKWALHYRIILVNTWANTIKNIYIYMIHTCKQQNLRSAYFDVLQWPTTTALWNYGTAANVEVSWKHDGCWLGYYKGLLSFPCRCNPVNKVNAFRYIWQIPLGEQERMRCVAYEVGGCEVTAGSLDPPMECCDDPECRWGSEKPAEVYHMTKTSSTHQ